MFHNSHSSLDSPSPCRHRVIFLIALILTACLALVTPVFAADPEEIDPDPGFTGPQLLILSDLAELDTGRLAPGRYIVRIVDGGRTTAVYEIVVAPR